MTSSIHPPVYDSDIGLLRNLISDTTLRSDPAYPAQEPEYLFDDARLQAFLTINNGGVRFAAADCIDAIADNEALVLKKIRTEDLQTDGPATANALRLHATSLRAQAKQEAAELADEGGMVIVDYQYRQHPHYPELGEIPGVGQSLWL